MRQFNIRSTNAADYDAITTGLVGARDSYRVDLGPLTATTRDDEQSNKRIDYLFTFGGVKSVSTIVDPAGPRIADHLAIFGTISLE